MSTLRRPAQLQELKYLIDFVTGSALRVGMGPGRIKEIELVTEEVLVNVFSYAYPDIEGEVTVDCHPAEDGLFAVEFRDAGVPFNMLQAEAPDISAEISDRQIGGLGIFLVKQLTRDVSYRREADENILTVLFDIADRKRD